LSVSGQSTRADPQSCASFVDDRKNAYTDRFYYTCAAAKMKSKIERFAACRTSRSPRERGRGPDHRSTNGSVHLRGGPAVPCTLRNRHGPPRQGQRFVRQILRGPMALAMARPPSPSTVAMAPASMSRSRRWGGAA
jgi:hypothetical protein